MPKKKLIHRAWDWRRTRYIPGVRERVFADEWEKEAMPKPGINSGHGTLQGLLIDRKDSGIFSPRRVIAEVGPRDAMIVATMMQWLGTNCGSCWLQATLKKAGYQVVKIPDEESRWDGARVRLEFTGANRAIIKYFKKTFMMEEIAKMPAACGLELHEFRRAFKYLTDVGICETLLRGPNDKEKFASLTPVGVDLIQYAHFNSDEMDTLILDANVSLKWLEKTKFPYDWIEDEKKEEKKNPQRTKEERIAAIKAAQQDRINARKFGELSHA